MTGGRAAIAPETWLRSAAIAAIAGGYLFFFPYFGHLRNPNENVRVYMVLAAVDRGTFALNGTIDELGPVDDRSINPSQRCAVRQASEPCVYSSKAPGTSYLGMPVYLIVRSMYRFIGRTLTFAATIYWLRLCCVIMPSLFFLFAFNRFITAYVHGEFERLLVVGSLALGTMSYTYAHGFVGHQLAAILVFGSFLLIERARSEREPASVIAAAGFAAGYAAITEYPAAALAPLLFVYAIVRCRAPRIAAGAAFAAGAAIPALLGMWYHQACFGRPWRTGYSMLGNPAFAQFHSVGVFGISRPDVRAAWYNLFSPARGLFFFAPFLLFGLPGLVFLWRSGRRAESTLAAAIVALCVLYQSSVNPDIGGWSIGPRYIVLVVPFLAFAAAAFLEATPPSSPIRYLLVIPSAVLSITYTLLSTIVFHAFPPEFTNPFYEWVLPLARMGYFNYSAGTWLGLRGLTSALPGLIPVAALIAAFYWGPRGVSGPARARRATAAALMTSLLFTAASHLRRFNGVEKDAVFGGFVALWEPPRAGMNDVAAASRRAADRPQDAEAQADLGRWLAATGNPQAALEQYARAAALLDRTTSSQSERRLRSAGH